MAPYPCNFSLIISTVYLNNLKICTIQVKRAEQQCRACYWRNVSPDWDFRQSLSSGRGHITITPSLWTRPSFINVSWSDNAIVSNPFHPSKHKAIRGERCERQYGNKYGTYLQISPQAARAEKILRVVWLLFLNIFLFSLVTSSKNGLNVSGWVTESTRREHSKLKCQITLAILLPKGHAWWLVRKYVPECSLESHWTKPEWTGV